MGIGALLRAGGISAHGGGSGALTFTRSAGTGTSPLITAAAAADADFVWTGPGGTFTGKQPDIANFPAGDFTLRSNKWDTVTAIDFGSRLLTAFEIAKVLPRTTALEQLNSSANAGLVADVSGWVLSACINNLNIYNTGVFGDISGWTVPAAAVTFRLDSTSVTGDISGWVLPAGMRYFYLFSTGISYGTSGGMATITRNASLYQFQGCGLVAAEVDRILADCVASGTTGSTLNVAGTNAAPTGGALNADYVTLTTATGSGGLGWTVTIS